MMKPIAPIIVPFLPEKMLNKYLQGKMTLAMLKNHEDIFDKISLSLSKKLEEYHVNSLAEDDPFNIVQLAENSRITEGYINYISTLKRSLFYVNDSPKCIKQKNNSQEFGSPTWYDMFREIAMRRCEVWRRDLLAKCAAIEDESPGTITLKTLWNIGILETQSFLLLSLFFDSGILAY